MKRTMTLAVAVLAALAVTGIAFAGDAGKEVTLEGTILCAKCSLKEKRDGCQNVLAVGSGDEVEYYYLVKNDVYEKVGDVCTAKKRARVTGILSDRDGKHWLEPKEIVPIEKKS
ncbi:MAG: hypothetical protein D6718_08145 [Acidobacteria bacterium]|nr:MAG: hypothetical protein D6718_08145 [Acidobacteriota bacterium]